MPSTNLGLPALTLKNVSVAYQRRAGIFRKEHYWALNNVSFDVRHGETLGVIGRNGVGKSTLLRLLAGIISPDKGVIVNHDVTASLLSLQVGFVPLLTGKENAILSGMMLGLSKKDIISRLDEIEVYADIGGFFLKPVREYSTGMRARLGFSVAVHANSDVILLDEVLGVGDIDFKAKSTQTMMSKMEDGNTVVIVSHNAGLISKTCNRTVWIENGKVMAFGGASEVLSEYNSFMKKRR